MDIHNSKISNAANTASSKAKSAAHVDDWVRTWAKYGHFAKGVVYCLVGGLTAAAAFGVGGQVTNPRDSLKFILEQPFGKVLLGIVAIGLLFYAFWRIYQAIKDPGNKGDDKKGIAKRLGYGWSGLVYGALAVYAGMMVINGGSSGSSGSGTSRQGIVSTILGWSGGQIILGAIGVIIILVGLYQIYKAYSEKYKENIQQTGLSGDKQDILMKTGKAGYTARGIVWCIIGYLFIRAAIEHNSSDVGGTQQAFQFLQNSSFGPWLLGLVAIGLFCYGVFMFVKGKYGVVRA